VLQEFKLENLTVRKREVGCSPVIREFEIVFLTVGNPYRKGRREWISSSEAMIYQWTSLGICLMVKKDSVPRPHTTYIYILFLRYCELCASAGIADICSAHVSTESFVLIRSSREADRRRIYTFAP
jgi:hypothetical protein